MANISKEKLIKLLENSANSSDFPKVIKDLKKPTTIIPPDHDKEVVEFLELLAQSSPKLLQNHLKNQELIDFYNTCKANVKANELKTGRSR